MMTVNFYVKEVERDASDYIVFKNGLNSVGVDIKDVTWLQIDYVMLTIRMDILEHIHAEFNFRDEQSLARTHEVLADIVTEVRE